MTYIVLIASVLLGLVIALVLKPKTKLTQLLLSFSGAYLLAITILHLLPEVFSNYALNNKIGLYILAGVLLQLILDFFSRGAEHGHIHTNTNNKIPIALLVSLSFHAFLEGLPLGHAHNHSHLLWAIVVHKIPIAIILATFLLNSNLPKLVTGLLLIGFSLMSPLGSFLGESIPILITYKTQITAVIIGVL
ncbi:MAG TPA: hypothetical protein VJ970_00295, partial [Flavobacteriaceae bacterium]|nr:hypothetical protein [Flavobacteriaceae bacterium]